MLFFRDTLEGVAGNLPMSDLDLLTLERRMRRGFQDTVLYSGSFEFSGSGLIYEQGTKVDCCSLLSRGIRPSDVMCWIAYCKWLYLANDDPKNLWHIN